MAKLSISLPRLGSWAAALRIIRRQAESADMFGYYTELAARGLRNQFALTILMIGAIAVGIGASMTTLTVYRSVSADPIPGKSSQLFTPQIDTFGPAGAMGPTGDDGLQDRLSYKDAKALLAAHAGFRQVALYATRQPLIPSDVNDRPFNAGVRATSADFFPMFEVPFLYGRAWTAQDDADRSSVVVLSRDLNDRLFSGANSVGKVVTLDGVEYRVVGVLDRWQPLPRFYDLDFNVFGSTEDIFLPFTVAIDHKIEFGNINCHEPANGWDELIRGECVWAHFWVELPTAAAVSQYRQFLTNYAAEQKRSGRFKWQARTQLRDVRDWLTYHKVVSTETRILVVVSFSFLFVCLLNSAGLMLAKVVACTSDTSVRRALGASRRAIFAQCLIETALVGIVGGLLGLLLTDLGLELLRSLVSEESRSVLHLDAVDVGLALILAVVATIAAGIYPTWRAARLQPALQLKSL
jgi:putative ABC transport system permease protein